MTSDSLFWFFSALVWTFVMSFYSTQEMACISFNKLRLRYYVSLQKKWAIWLHGLLCDPTLLFSTTLFGVNLALMASSESTRRLFDSLGWNPNLAPLVQIPFVVLFGELVPMFAARVCSEHMAKIGVGPLYASAWVLRPVALFVDWLFRGINKLFGREQKETAFFITREELQRLIEESDSQKRGIEKKQVPQIAANIFSLRNTRADQLMTEFTQVMCVSSQMFVKEVRPLFLVTDSLYIPVYHRSRQKMIGIVRAQDLLYAQDTRKIRDFVQNVHCVAENTTGFELLRYLQKEQYPCAIVLNALGVPVGFVSVDDVLEELFSEEIVIGKKNQASLYLEKTFPASASISDFNEAYGMQIATHGCTTFDELIEHLLQRAPTQNESVFVDSVEIIVKETSLFRAKTILIRTRK